MIDGQAFLLALVGGILPALLWLWFWLREDRRCPEPKGLIALAFLAGMLAVPLVIFPEKLVELFFAETMVIILWAAIEEVGKVAVALGFLRSRAMNEPIDAVIYMITVALGFAALENALFILDPLTGGFFTETLLTGNFRFIGATLLHTLSSATIGIMIALSFYYKESLRRTYTLVGIILAIALHALFNFFILKSNGASILSIFLVVWIGIIIVILVMEHIKRMQSPRSLVHPQ
jgi:RsiW-degrading membrane proteinase PrsW (M82 family)